MRHEMATSKAIGAVACFLALHKRRACVLYCMSAGTIAISSQQPEDDHGQKANTNVRQKTTMEPCDPGLNSQRQQSVFC